MSYTYIDPTENRLLREKVEALENYKKMVDAELKATEMALRQHHKFLNHKQLLNDYLAWQVANRMEE